MTTKNKIHKRVPQNIVKAYLWMCTVEILGKLGVRETLLYKIPKRNYNLVQTGHKLTAIPSSSNLILASICMQHFTELLSILIPSAENGGLQIHLRLQWSKIMHYYLGPSSTLDAAIYVVVHSCTILIRYPYLLPLWWLFLAIPTADYYSHFCPMTGWHAAHQPALCTCIVWCVFLVFRRSSSFPHICTTKGEHMGLTFSSD